MRHVPEAIAKWEAWDWIFPHQKDRHVNHIALFDIDKTLIARSKAHYLAFLSSMKTVYGVEIDLHTFTHHGLTDQQIIHAILLDAGWKTPNIEARIAQCMGIMVEDFLRFNQTDTVALCPGVKELLIALSQKGFYCGLVTGNLEKIAWPKLKNAGIDSYFSFGGFGSDHPDRKQLALLALSRCKETYSLQGETHVVLFGDTPNDIVAAHSIGAMAIGVATGHPSPEALHAAGADYVFKDLNDTQKVLEVLHGN